jgi:hypothetical protein
MEQKLRIFKGLYLIFLNVGLASVVHTMFIVTYYLPLLVSVTPAWIGYFVIMWVLGGVYILLAIAGNWLAYKGRLFQKKEA